MAETGPEVGLLFDTGHCLFAGGSPLDFVRRHAGRINHFHGKDVRADVLTSLAADDPSFIEAVMANLYTVPGDGLIDFPTILQTLASSGYQGWLVVEAEQDLRKSPPLEYARLGYSNLRRMAEAAGFVLA